ncbi:kinase-like domain-containing protein [Mucidula mucida]|nr:kinase-like domain-containing protein [Mucidula mucida]
MSIKDLISLSGVPGLDVAVTSLTSTYAAVENVKLYKKQCEDMSSRCVSLMLSLRDSSTGLEGNRAAELIDEVNHVVERINRKVLEWAALSRLRSFMSQREIKDGIDRLQHDIDAAIGKFNIQLNLELSRVQLEARATQERDRAEFRELLQKIVRSTDDMKVLLSAQSTAVLEDVMESLQNELHESSTLEPGQEKSFRQGLWWLHDQTSKLPPLEDLTGQVTLERDQPSVARGTFNDIFHGQWLDKEPVALRLPRALANSPDIRRRFKREVSIWRSLDKHPYVVPLYGFANIENETYSVSPWMDNGTAISFVHKSPDVDRLRLLTEIAEGLEYLHGHKIIHGDLRGANVLISRNATARLSDFGLSKFFEDCAQGLSTSPSMNPRWSAPELLLNTGSYSTYSDVWSFGMVALELLTGAQPFNSLPRDITVVRDLDHGKIPNRPASFAAPKELHNELWELMRRCWHRKPSSRPSISLVKTRLLELRGIISSPRKEKRNSLLSNLRSRTSSASSDGSGVKANTHLRIPSSLTSVPQGQPLPPSPSPSSVSEGLSSLSSVNMVSSATHARRFSNASSPPATTRHELITIDFDTGPSSLPADLGSYFPQSYSPLSKASSSTLPPPSTSEEPACSSSDSVIVHVNKQGSVVSGTLEGLVDRLITTSSTHLQRDMEYRDIMLTMCHGFASPESVFQTLSLRFRDAERRGVPTSQRIDVQFNIYVVILYWLSNSHLPIDPPLLAQLKEFCVSGISSHRSSTMNEKAKEILRAIEARSRMPQHAPVPSSPGNRKVPRSDTIMPENLAVALTLLEVDRFKAILPTDYLQHTIVSTSAGKVNTALATSARIQLWIKKSILHSDEQDGRVEVLKFFVLAAQECCRLRNFGSMASIVKALDSAPIKYLTLMKDALPAPLHRVLDEMTQILDPASNYRAYSKLYKDAPVAVPWLEPHLHELAGRMTFSRPLTESGGRFLINFERYVKFVDCIKDLMRLSGIEKELKEDSANDGPLVYLEHHLRNVERIDPHICTEADMMQRSEILRLKDERHYQLRTAQLKKLGFRTR